MLKKITTYLILSILLVSAQEQSNQEQVKQLLPALKVLPAGSVLKGVSIPRYFEDYTPSSHLKAERLEVVSQEEIHGTNVQIKLFSRQAQVKAAADFNRIIFNQQTQIISCNEPLLLEGEQFSLVAQGIAFDWKNKAGFLLGKNKTIVYTNKIEAMHSMSKRPSKKHPSSTHNKMLKKASTIVPAIIATTTLSSGDTTEPQTSSPKVAPIAQVEEFLIQTQAEVNQAEQAKKETAKKINLEEKQAELKDEELKEIKPEKGKEQIIIDSDGPLYFDANKGIISYTKNVTITHPQYTFNSKGGVQIQLTEKKDSKDKKDNNPGKKFGDISKIIAKNNVVLKGKDNKGNLIIAVTNFFTYNHKTGDIILYGIGSRITSPIQGQMKVTKEKGYIRLNRNFNASGEGVSAIVDISKLQNKNNPE